MAQRIEIIIKTTDACNARCAYCSAGSDPGGQRRLSVGTAGLLLRQANELIGTGLVERVRFLWHGGEPLLLGKTFFREVAATFAALPHRMAITHRLQTNLTLLDEEWIAILKPLIGRDGLGTSLDPFDDVRQLGSSDGYRQRWMASLGLLDRTGWRTGCVYVLHRLGLERANDLYWFFRNLRDNSMLSLRVNPLLRVGRARNTSCEGLLLSPGDYGRFLIEIAAIWLNDQRRLILSPIRDLVSAWQGRAVTSCDLAGRQGCVEGHLGIDPDGSVYNCGRAVDAGGMRFGRLGEVSLEECLRQSSRQVLLDRENALQEGPCGTCEYWRFCHGGCPYESHTESEQAHQPTLLCEDYRLFFDWLARKACHQRSAVSGQPNESNLPPLPRGGQGGCPTSLGGGGAVITPSAASAPVPIAPDDGATGVCAAASSGAPVILADPRRWSPGDLQSLADFFLHDPNLAVPIEPFYSALVHLSGNSASSGCKSLRQLYQEPVPTRRLDLPCATCEAFKFCRCFWLDPTPLPDHCRTWREVHGRVAQVLRTWALD